MTVIVTEDGVDRPYRVVERANGGARLVLERAAEPALGDMLAEHGLRRLTPEEFDRHFGHLPTDDEG